MGILTNLNDGDVLFIDEIHRLARVVEELLYPAMEDFVVNLVMDKGIHARSIKHRLNRFTLVGATTRPGMLSAPLRERFGIFHHLDFYSEADLVSIVVRSASILGAPPGPLATQLLLDSGRELSETGGGLRRQAGQFRNPLGRSGKTIESSPTVEIASVGCSPQPTVEAVSLL